MISLDDEEKKKRYERAINLTRSITGDYSSNFNNIALNNIQGNTDEEKEYIKRFNRARELTNSINPRENVPAPSATPEEIASSREVANSLLEEMQRGRETNTQNEQGNIDLNNRDVVQNADGSISTVRSISFEEDGKEVLIPTVVNGKVVSDKEAIEHYHKTGEHLGKFNSVEEANAYAEQLHKQQENLYSNTNTSNNGTSEKDKKKIKAEIESKVNNSAKPLQTVTADGESLKKNQITSNNAMNQIKSSNPKIATGIEEKNKVYVSDLEVEARNEAQKINENIKKGKTEAFQEWISTTGNNILGGTMKVAAGFANAATTLAALGIRGIQGASSLLGNEKIADDLNPVYEKIVEAGSSVKERGDYISNVTNRIDNKVIKTSGNISDVVTGVAVNAGIGYVTGIQGAGTIAQGVSVGGSSSQEVLDKNKDNIGKATVTGLAKGYVSYLTENMFDANILTKGIEKKSIEKAINNKISTVINSSLGKELAHKTIGIIGENIEEIVEDNVGYVIDKLVNNEDMPGFKEWLSNTTETAKITTASTIILNLLGLGGGQFKDIENDMQAQYWVNKAQEIIEQEDIGIHYNSEVTKSISDMQPFYITKFNQDGELTDVIPSLGKEITNPNSKLNVDPVVVQDKNTDYYQVIDGNSGVVLDNSFYESTMEAQFGFDEKVRDLTDIQIQSINNQIKEAEYSIKDRLINTLNQAEEQIMQRQTNNENDIPEETQNDTIEQNNNPTQESNSQENKIAQNGFSEEINDNSIPTERVQQEIQNNNIEQKSNSQVNKTIQTENKSFEDVATEAMQNISNDEVESPLQNRNIETIGKQKDVKAYQYDNPEVKPYFQEMAKMIGEDLSYISDSANRSTKKGGGTKLSTTTKAIDILHNEQGYSYNQIAQGLQNIIDDDGKENNAISKKLELIIDDQLRNGYTNALGKNIVPNQEYINTINGQTEIEKNEVTNSQNNDNYEVGQEEYKRIRDIVKYNENGTELKDSHYVDFLTNAAIGKVNYSQSILTTNDITNLLEEAKKKSVEELEKSKSLFNEKEYNNKIRNKTRKKLVDSLYNLVKDKQFSIEKRLLNEKTNQEENVKLNILISKGGIDETLHINDSIEKESLLPIIDKIIKTAPKGTTGIEVIKKGSKTNFNYLYNTAMIDGNLYGIKIDLRKTTSGDVFYVHRINILKEDLQNTVTGVRSSSEVNLKSSVNNSIPQKTKNVKSDTTVINKDMQKNKNNTSDNIRNLKKKEPPTKSTDNKGRVLTTQQQNFFRNSKVRDEQENLLEVYHGTNKSGFTIFNRNVNYYTDNEEVAKSYTGNNGIYKGYLNITNPLVIEANGETWSQIAIDNITISGIDNIEQFLKENGSDVFKEKGKLRTTTADIVAAIESAIDEGILKYDGIIIKNVYDEGMYGDGSTGKQLGNDYITFKSNQFKNSTNEMPTSNEDIRYMKKKSNSNKKNLIAQHNTSEEKLLEALNLGALPVPSIAITKNDTPILKYGDITLLFDKDTVNPSDKRNVAYNSDIYSTRKPTTGNILDKTKIKSFEKSMSDKGISSSYTNLIEEYLEQNDFRQVRQTLQYELQKNNENVDMQEVEDLYKEAIETIQEKRIMKPDVDPYTPSGNRKSIQQMSLPYTLDNIVQIMTKKSNKGSESNSFAGLPEVRANLSKQFKSIEAMHNSENNLISSEEMEKLKEELNDKFYNIVDKIGEYDNVDRYFGSSEVVANALNETAKSKNITKEVLDNELDYVSIKNVPEKVLQEAVDFLNSLKDVPTEYFEAKPQRAVGFDEVKKAIIPANTSKEIIEALKEKGVEIEYYSSQEERTKKISNSEDIRFMKKNNGKTFDNKIRNDKQQNIKIDKENTEKSYKTNGERADAWIEQEIKKIEGTGKWDNNIPATSLTDIRKTIEEYLGLGIKKGKFRQSAYALYKGTRDVIRTKEYKDIDSILHETGHALDLGNRLNLDKESIADELLTAVSKLDGYEDETRTVKLEEGFAEVIREYSIIPEQAKKDYPQSVAVIERIRQNDKDFDKFISKVQQQTYNYIHQNPQNRVHSNQSIGEQTDKAPLTKAWVEQEVMRNIWDKDYAVKKVVTEFAKISGKTVNQTKASDNAYYLTRLATGIHDKVISMLSDGYINENGDKIMPGLNQIGQILGDNPQRYNDLRDYLVARRDTDYKAKTLKTGIRDMDTKYVIEKFKNDTQIQEAADVIYKTLDGVMQYAVDNGLISSDDVKTIKESNAFYVPMQRVIERRGNQLGKKGAVSDIIKARTGSELDIKDVLENIITNSSNIIQQVENNNVLRALYNQGEEAGLTGAIYDVIDTPMMKVGTANLSMWESELKKQGVDIDNLDLEKTVDLFAPNNKVDTKNLITSFINEDGKRVYLQFNDEILFNSLMNMDKKFMSQVLKINSKLNMPLRYGATMANLGFAIPNMISDTAQAAIFSNAGFIPVVDNALGVLDILTATNKHVKNFVKNYSPEYVNRIENMYTVYKQSGATNSTRMSQFRDTTQNVMKDVYGTKNSEVLDVHEKWKPLKRLLDILTYIPEISEQSTRFRVFEKNYDLYKQKGNSETDARILAALESRDATQDFGRTGNLTREINQLIPFSAARVGSSYTFAEKVKANPKQTAMRIAILSAIAMAIKAIGYKDKEIEELNQRKKDDNFVLKIGGNVVTIKKPQGLLRSIVNLTEYIQDLATGHIEDGKEGERLGNWINNAIMDNMPADSVTGLVPNMVAPLIENAINKDLYYNTDIVKSYDLDLPDSQQYYEYNSQLAILLGKAFNYSPAKIDNLISGYFAGLGTQVTNIIDYASGKIGITAQKPEMGAESNAVGKRFIVNVNSNSASIDEIYNRKTELTKKLNGGTITSEEETELETIKSAVSNMSKVNKQIREVKKDLQMSGKEKAEQIRILQQQRTDIARQALGKDLINSENISNIEMTSFYPTNNSLSLNHYTLELTSEMKEEYSSLASEFYKKYENQGLYSDEKLKQIKTKSKEYAKKTLMQKYRSELQKTN